MKSIILCVLLGLIFSSCNNEKVSTNLIQENGVETDLKYTNLFTITKFTSYTKVVVYNPWKPSEIYASYSLVPKDQKVPDLIPKDDILVRTPIDNMVALSSPHIGLFGLFSAEGKITAVGQTEYVYNKSVQDRIKRGEIQEVGIAQNMNIELLIDLEPDLVMATGNQQIHDNLTLAIKYGIPIVYIIEWMEQSPLARAEWVKYAGVFLNENAKADSIFNEIESAYLKTVEIAQSVEEKPKVILGKKFKGTWYMAGGGSYFARYLKDAGADYYWQSDSTTGSLPLSFEEVADKQMDAEIWLNPGQAMSISQILEEDERYSYFKAFQDKQVYNHSKKIAENGANAYWESGFVNPHLVLSDLIKILHPDLLPDHELVYYEKLSD